MYIRGRSDKYLAYEKGKKILEKLQFISEHRIILALSSPKKSFSVVNKCR